jgi:lipoprotein-releasing system permease protein
MILATSLINGFQREISEKVYGFWGHIQITQLDLNQSFENSPISIHQPFYPGIQEQEGIRHIQAFITKPAIIKTEEFFEGVILKGIGNDFDWSFIEQHLEEGRKLVLPEDSMSFDIVISRTTAERLRLKIDQRAAIHFIDPETRTTRLRVLSVVGIYNTGLGEYDKLFALVDIRQIQRLNNWDSSQVGGFEVFVDDPDELEEAGQRVYDLIGPDLNSKTIREMQPSIFDWLDLQTTNEYLVLIIMAIVAAINMITALLILILERTPMIGTLKALGAANWSIRKVFLLKALYIIGFGLLLGNLVGLGLGLVQDQLGLITLPEETYYVSVAPVSFNWLLIALLNLGATAVCLLSLIGPSYLVSRISPVKALRFD